MSPDTAGRLKRWLGHRQEEMTDLLRHLVEAESPSLEPEAVKRCARTLAESLAPTGLAVRQVAGAAAAPGLLARPRRRDRSRALQLLLGHMDTVWASGTLERMPVHLENGRLYGPGAFDMKGGLVVAVYALRALRELRLEPAVDPVLYVTADEEIGSPDSYRHIVRLARIADRCLVLEPGLGPQGKLKTARKGNGMFEIRVRGRAAHAGLEPEKGASAILELSRLVQQLFALNDPARGISVNVGTIDGGLRTNMVAPESRASVDIRILRAEDAPGIEAAIRSLRPSTPGTRIEIEGGMNRMPLERTPRNRRLWQRARRAAYDLGMEVEEGISGGGSDGNITSLYCATIDGLGVVGDGAHAAHEHARLDSLPDRAALLAALLLEPPIRRRNGSRATAHAAEATQGSVEIS